jgi:hypothetical protein
MAKRRTVLFDPKPSLRKLRYPQKFVSAICQLFLNHDRLFVPVMLFAHED